MKRSVREYAEALYQAVSEKPKEARQIVQRFLSSLVAEHGRDRLPLILEELDRLVAEERGQVIVTVTTAVELDESEVTQIERLLTDQLKVKGVELHQEIDPQLIGGIRIKIGDKVIDHTIKAKLDQLTHQLTA